MESGRCGEEKNRVHQDMTWSFHFGPPQNLAAVPPTYFLEGPFSADREIVRLGGAGQTSGKRFNAALIADVS
ncbi:hypothetical protein STSP2_00337 [Anaerohalosphaera lusitana]|uniref:Uncharacterized protein n=1 Tax=Anaerohalosphaera lusitana TaxID=1936003 RepID=A0A1U9NHH0_9BACT|nr:hypothetical protein STSP2_00337 [Anaerohalosphaera lusitana]